MIAAVKTVIGTKGQPTTPYWPRRRVSRRMAFKPSHWWDALTGAFMAAAFVGIAALLTVGS